MDKKHVMLLVYVALVGALSGLAHEQAAWAPYIHLALPMLAAVAAYAGITSPKAGTLPGQTLNAVIWLVFLGFLGRALVACSGAQLQTEDKVLQKALTGEQLGCAAVEMLTNGAARADAFILCGILQPLTTDAEKFVQTLEAAKAAKSPPGPRDGGGG